MNVDRITQKGIDYSLDLLNKGGYLADSPTDSTTLNLVYLIEACEKYINDNVAKGETRTFQEQKDGILILFFQNYLKEQLFLDPS